MIEDVKQFSVFEIMLEIYIGIYPFLNIICMIITYVVDSYLLKPKENVTVLVNHVH